MLTNDDKNWIASQICAREECVGAPLISYEQRIAARLEKFQATLIAEFRKWKLPENDHPRIDSAALRAMDLELEALLGRVEKLEGK